MLVAGLLVCLGAACSDRPAEPVAVAGVEGGAGRILYLTHCASCHGPEGRGDGVVAGALREPATDLTRLWERYGTPLDRERLEAYIDGRRLLDAHGRDEMPVWGEEFFDDLSPDAPGLDAARRGLMDSLVRHLEGLQSRRRAALPGAGEARRRQRS
jgi:mono/diheme cytochrome c family protein